MQQTLGLVAAQYSDLSTATQRSWATVQLGDTVSQPHTRWQLAGYQYLYCLCHCCSCASLKA